LEAFCEADTMVLAGPLTANVTTARLTAKICELIDRYNLLEFIPLDANDTEEFDDLISKIDLVLEYFDHADYGDPEFQMAANDGEDGERADEDSV
jgi:hypothetical protein